jgi:hypothetical protein
MDFDIGPTVKTSVLFTRDELVRIWKHGFEFFSIMSEKVINIYRQPHQSLLVSATHAACFGNYWLSSGTDLLNPIGYVTHQ